MPDAEERLVKGSQALLPIEDKERRLSLQFGCLLRAPGLELSAEFGSLAEGPLSPEDWLVVELSGELPSLHQDVDDTAEWRDFITWIGFSLTDDEIIKRAAVWAVKPEPEPYLSWGRLLTDHSSREIAEVPGTRLEARRVRFTTFFRDPTDQLFMMVRPCRLLLTHHFLLAIWEPVNLRPHIPDEFPLIVETFGEPDPRLPTTAEIAEISGWWTAYDLAYRGDLPTRNRGNYATAADAAERYVLRAALSQLEAVRRLGQEVETAELTLLSVEDQSLPSAHITSAQPELLAHLGFTAEVRRQLREVQDPIDAGGQPGPIRWFADATERGPEISRTVETAFNLARELAEDARDALATMGSVATSRQLRLSYESETRSAALQRAITLLGAVVLGPSLVALSSGRM